MHLYLRIENNRITDGQIQKHGLPSPDSCWLNHD